MAEDTTAATPSASPLPAPPPERVWRVFDPTQALALPEGSVRALIALLVIGADIFMMCYKSWAPPTLDTMATVAFTFYFAQGLNRPKPNA